MRWYWSALRMTPASATGWPSSLKPAAPARASSTCSVSSAPLCPAVIGGEEPDPHGGLLLAALQQRLRAPRPCRRPARCWAWPRWSRTRRPPPPGCRWRCPPGPRGPACAGGRAGRRSRGRPRSPPASTSSRPVGRAADAALADDQVADLVDARRPGRARGPAQHEGRGRAGPLDEPAATRPRRPRSGSAGSAAPAGSVSRSYRTAIRTIIPLAAWRTISVAGSSARAPEISTPRLIGPACITRWPGRRRSWPIP